MLDLIENDHLNPKIRPNRNSDFPPHFTSSRKILGSYARGIRGDFFCVIKLIFLNILV